MLSGTIILKFYERRNVMRYRTGTIFNQKHATGTASLPMQTAPSALALLIVRFTYSQVANTLK
jgi:hypothetical protein